MKRLSLCIQAVLCLLVISGVLLAVAGSTISGMVKDGEGNGVDGVKVSVSNGSPPEVRDVTYTGEDGSFTTDSLPADDYTVRADDSNDFFTINLSGADIFNVNFTSLISKKKATPTPTPAPTPGIQTSGQVKFAQASYNMYPVIQMNTSWKRASKMEPITFDSGNSYDPDGYIKAYEWTFGDGSMTEGRVVDHAYKEEGRYTVKLRVVDNNGAERSAYVTAIISNKPPVAVPGNDTNATAGEAIWFNGSASYDPDGQVVKYEWAFGDGTTGQGAAVLHAYARPDKYKAELKVTDDSGDNTTAYKTVNVSGSSPAPVPAKSGGSQGMLLLAGAGVACVALIFLTRKKSK